MKHITKISLTFIALTLAMSANAASGIDWNAIGWVEDNGNTAYAQKYKVSQDNGQPNIVNIQNKDGQLAIYVHVPAAITECSVSSVIGGAGIWLHLSAFTAQETQVTIKYDAGKKSCTFWVYYADGSGDAGGSDVDEPETPSNYCQKELTGTVYSKQITMTCTKESEGNYKIVITGENLNGLGGSYVYINGRSSYKLSTSISSSSTTEIVCNIVSTTDPSFHTPLYVKFKEGGSQVEENFSQPDYIRWGVCNIEPTPEPIYNSISESICYGETYTWNGQTYSTAGEYTQEFTAVNGADSIVTLTLTVYPQTPDVTEDVTIDFGETYTWNNQEYTATGTYTTTLQDANGCDYQATLNLTVNSNSPSTPSACIYEGIGGDGQTAGAGDLKIPFDEGYVVTLELNDDKTQLNIQLQLKEKDIENADRAYFLNYPEYDITKTINHHELNKSSTVPGLYTRSLPINQDYINNYEKGIILFAIKVDYPNHPIKVTLPEYFRLDGSDCPPRVFTVYHHDDFPSTEEESEYTCTQFNGGVIYQPIQYKRRMPSEVWETLSVPFDVDSVTAFDPATGEHVRLYAQYNNGSTQAGNYWLRSFQTSSVTRDNFQANWQDISATSADMAKPEKDKAYIIRLPNGGGYYNDKYIVFHGRGYQTIAKTYNAPDLPQDDYYSYSGNNTMMPQSLTSAYVLDNAGVYFQSLPTVTLYPFECSVNATASTIARMPRFALNGKDNTTTDLSDIPTTDYSQGVIYTIYGACVARFNTIEEYDHAYQTLLPGIYIVSTPSATTKIQIP